MTAQRFSDDQLGAALRRVTPTRAQADLRGRIRAEVETTTQQRALPPVLAALGDADPLARRKALLLVAMLLLALSVSVALAVGASINRRPPDRQLSLEPPADPIAFVRTAYSAMPDLPPLSLTAVENGARKIRIHVDRSGSVRIERYESVAATDPDSYTIFAGSSMGELIEFQGRAWWREQAGAIGEDPRVFVYAAIGQAGWGAQSARCATVVSDPSVDPILAASDIEYVGAEYVLDRPTHRFRCGGDRWIDVETRLVLRSEGPAREPEAAGAIDRIEVTELLFGQPPAELFELEAPPGVALMSEEDYECSQDPQCLATPRPVISPSPAKEQGPAPVDLDALLADADGAVDRLPPFEATFRRSNTKYPGSDLRVHHDGAGRSRMVETREESGGDPPSVTLAGPDGQYQSQLREDRSIIWYSLPERAGYVTYPIADTQPCEGGWEHGGVDMVGGRAADRLDCPAGGASYWIDRDLGILLRWQSVADPRYGTDVVELVSLRFAPQPSSLFELPEDAVVGEQ